MDEIIKFSEHENKFYDSFGNRINNYIVEKYYKNTNVWHLEETIKTNSGSYFVVDDKFYFRGNSDSLIPLNMDFDSKDCHACYKIVGEDTESYVKIIGNIYLCENSYLNLRLHKQDYSDGTCFYSLQDSKGDFRVNYGNYDLTKLIKVLKETIRIKKKYLDKLPSAKNSIEQTMKLITEMQQFITDEGINMEKRKVLFASGVYDRMVIITDAPKESLEQWCRDYSEYLENGENPFFDELKKEYYVKVLHDSELENNSDDIEVIGYDEVYCLDDY